MPKNFERSPSAIIRSGGRTSVRPQAGRSCPEGGLILHPCGIDTNSTAVDRGQGYCDQGVWQQDNVAAHPPCKKTNIANNPLNGTWRASQCSPQLPSSNSRGRNDRAEQRGKRAEVVFRRTPGYPRSHPGYPGVTQGYCVVTLGTRGHPGLIDGLTGT